MSIRIQLVNEQNLICEGLRCLLQTEDVLFMDPVKCSNHCGQACRQSGCDIIVMGTNAGGASALDCVHQIISRHADARILLIICKEQLSLTHEAIRAGAKGVVSMDVPSPMLREAIRIIAKGGQFIEPWLARTISETPYSHVSNPFDLLSPREKMVLEMMLDGCSCASIADKLNISEKTVANHHTHVMKKLAVKNLVELTRMAIRHNLIQA
ncbi:MAG: response regulator transcription factor [Mariprofundus sp.]